MVVEFGGGFGCSHGFRGERKENTIGVKIRVLDSGLGEDSETNIGIQSEASSIRCIN